MKKLLSAISFYSAVLGSIVLLFLSLKMIQEAPISSDGSRVFLYLLLVAGWAHIVTSLIYYRRMMYSSLESGSENSPSDRP